MFTLYNHPLPPPCLLLLSTPPCPLSTYRLIQLKGGSLSATVSMSQSSHSCHISNLLYSALSAVISALNRSNPPPPNHQQFSSDQHSWRITIPQALLQLVRFLLPTYLPASTSLRSCMGSPDSCSVFIYSINTFSHLFSAPVLRYLLYRKWSLNEILSTTTWKTLTFIVYNFAIICMWAIYPFTCLSWLDWLLLPQVATNLECISNIFTEISKNIVRQRWLNDKRPSVTSDGSKRTWLMFSCIFACEACWYIIYLFPVEGIFVSLPYY